VSLCVHAAGLKPERKKLLQTSAASFARQLEVNGMGGFNFLTNVASIMKEGGTIVGITTIGVVNTEAAKSLGGYIPAKYVLQGILSMLREELLPRKVFVYALAPGFMEDGMNKDIPKAFVEMVKTKSKTKQLATAEGIAERVMSLHENKDQQKPLTITYAPEYE
jgi:NAD(P)-dependent dehydrogenase (short-subunit alcohol dehydrogenase family)